MKLGFSLINKETFLLFLDFGMRLYIGTKRLSEIIDNYDETIENIKKIKRKIEELSSEISEFLNKLVLDIKEKISKSKENASISFNNNHLNIEEEIYRTIKYYKENCYVLCSPKNIKDSLLTRLSNKIRTQNIDLLIIQPKDLIDKEVNNWYFRLTDIINDAFCLNCPSLKWNNITNIHSPAKKFEKYLKDNIVKNNVLFPNNKKAIIIFDEIESIFNDLEFQADFFDIIDQLYHSEYVSDSGRKLNFIFFGSAKTNDDIYPIDEEITFAWQANFDNLINPRRKLFKSNLVGLDINDSSLNNIFKYIFDYTKCSPLLTQHFIHLLVENKSSIIKGKEKKFVKKLCNRLIKDFES